MGREAERRTIEVLLTEMWPSEYGSIAWANVPFEVPQNSRWAQVTILTYSRDRVSLGADVWLNRSVGSVQIDLFSPQDTGASDNKKASDFLEEYFEDRLEVISIDEKVQFFTPESRETTGVQERQEGTNDNWFRTIVDIPFQRDEVRRRV